MRIGTKLLSLALCLLLAISSSTCMTEFDSDAITSPGSLSADSIAHSGSNTSTTIELRSHKPIAPEDLSGGAVAEAESEPDPWPIVNNVRLAFTGDLMVHDVQIDAAYNPADGTYSFMSYFEYITPYLKDADYTIGNLETTLSGAAAVYGGYPVFNTPDEFAEALKAAGFNMLITANNHSNDRGESGIRRTIEMLDSLGFDHIGTYASQEEQETIFHKEINGIRFAFLNYTYSTNGIPLASGKPYLVNMLDEVLMQRQIRQARSEGAEMIVVMPHMGDEYAESPATHYRNLAQRLCEYGADIVMASHPHVLQPTEVIEVDNWDGTMRTCFIAYSMGNFVSGQRNIPCDVGAVFYLDFEKIVDEHGSSVRITQASFAPTWVLFRNPSWEIDIKVLPVSDTLKAVDAGEDLGIGIWDIARMRDVHRQTTRKMLGEEVPESEMKPVYTLYKALS